MRTRKNGDLLITCLGTSYTAAGRILSTDDTMLLQKWRVGYNGDIAENLVEGILSGDIRVDSVETRVPTQSVSQIPRAAALGYPAADLRTLTVDEVRALVWPQYSMQRMMHILNTQLYMQIRVNQSFPLGAGSSAATTTVYYMNNDYMDFRTVSGILTLASQEDRTLVGAGGIAISARGGSVAVLTDAHTYIGYLYAVVKWTGGNSASPVLQLLAPFGSSVTSNPVALTESECLNAIDQVVEDANDQLVGFYRLAKITYARSGSSISETWVTYENHTLFPSNVL